MGWEAETMIIDVKLFERASDRVQEQTGSADGYLAKGGLGCSICGRIIGEAVGISPWSEDDWSAEMVRNYFESATWPEISYFNMDIWWAIESSKAFMETCVELKSGIKFSW